MSGRKGMKKYPMGIRAEVVTRIRAGESQRALRQIWLWLEKWGIHRNPKTILRIMEKYGLLSEIRRRRKWQQLGQYVYKYENFLNRQLHADRPNGKWVANVSYMNTR